MLTNLFTDPIQAWTSAHPFLAWLITNPLYALGLMLLLFLLLGGLLRLISKFVEQVWLALLRLPIQLMQSFVNSVVGQLGKGPVFKGQMSGAGVLDRNQRLTAILNRLDEIRQEQEVLLREMQALVQGQQAK
jgi:hypothetical protein